METVSKLRKRLLATKLEIARLEKITDYPNPEDIIEMIELHEKRMQKMIDQLSVVTYIETQVIPAGISKN